MIGIGLPIKFCLVNPPRMIHPLATKFVHSGEWIRNHPVRNEIQMDIPGNHSRKPRRRGELQAGIIRNIQAPEVPTKMKLTFLQE
jgi:hypothetical protein